MKLLIFVTTFLFYVMVKFQLNKPTKQSNLDEIVKAMVGRSLENRFPTLTNKPGEVILQVNSLTTRYEPIMKTLPSMLEKVKF